MTPERPDRGAAAFAAPQDRPGRRRAAPGGDRIPAAWPRGDRRRTGEPPARTSRADAPRADSPGVGRSRGDGGRADGPRNGGSRADERRAGRRPDATRRAPDPRGTPGRSPRRARLSWPDRLLRGLAGVLAGGLAVLGLVLVAVWFGADHYGLPGPGTGTVVGHLVGAAVAVAGQRVADRRADRTGTLAALAVVLVTVLVLGFAWFL